MSSKPRPTVAAQLDHVALATHDVEGLRDFYVLLGGVAASPPDTDPDTGLYGCAVDFCGVRLKLLRPAESGETAGDGRSSPLVHLAFALGSADAVDELTGVIAAAGYRVREPPHRTCELGCYESVVLDPDGNRLKLTV